MQKTKKVPQRKCIACQERDSKKGLIRIVKNKEGQIFLDPIGKANGRGAYICKDAIAVTDFLGVSILFSVALSPINFCALSTSRKTLCTLIGRSP